MMTAWPRGAIFFYEIQKCVPYILYFLSQITMFCDSFFLHKHMTRPDLAFPSSELSKYVHYPQPSHMAAAEHVLRYLRATYQLRIMTKSIITVTLFILTNSGLFLVDSVTSSTSEAEYMVSSLWGQEIVYIRAILLHFCLLEISAYSSASTRIILSALLCLSVLCVASIRVT